MTFGLCFLTESGTGKSVAVNPYLVRVLRELDAGRVEILFENDLQVVIDGTVASVAESLRHATW